MFTIVNEELPKFYQLHDHGIQAYALIEKCGTNRPSCNEVHLTIFVVGKSGGITGFKHSFDTKSTIRHRQIELGHNPYDLHDVCAYMHKALCRKLVKESLNPDLIPDNRLYDLFITGEENLEPYEPEVYLYDDPDGYIYTMKERKQ